MDILLFPPLAFLVSLAFVLALNKLLSPLSTVAERKPGSKKHEAYGCGEDVPPGKAEPDYHGFFPFAIFFTLLHVAGLMLATWSLNPAAEGFALVAAYLVAVGAILAILFTE
jgi:NADH:ubiquinone oxidoreductase subunit 3 (subunit A)